MYEMNYLHVYFIFLSHSGSDSLLPSTPPSSNLANNDSEPTRSLGHAEVYPVWLLAKSELSRGKLADNTAVILCSATINRTNTPLQFLNEKCTIITVLTREKYVEEYWAYFET